MRRRAWPLLAVAALFVGPFVVALLLYAGRDSGGSFDQLPNPDRELIANPPVIPLAPLRLADGSDTDPAWARSRWSLIYARRRPCDDACADALTRLHQVWLALGSERDRVSQILLVPEGQGLAAAAAPASASARSPARPTVPEGFLIGLVDAPENAALVPLFGRERLEQGRYFVVDPLGNIILSYPDQADQQRLLEDLERLLEISRVG